LISGEPVIYFGSRRAIFAFVNKNVDSRRGCQTPFAKKAKPRFEKAKPGKRSQIVEQHEKKISLLIVGHF